MGNMYINKFEKQKEMSIQAKKKCLNEIPEISHYMKTAV